MTQIILTTIEFTSREAATDFKDEHQPILDGIAPSVQWQFGQSSSGYYVWTLHTDTANDAAMVLAHLTATLIDRVAYMVLSTEPKRVKAGRREKLVKEDMLHREDGPALLLHNGPHPGQSLWFNSPQNTTRPRLTNERFFLFDLEMFERDMPTAIAAIDAGADEPSTFKAWREAFYGTGVTATLRGGVVR